MSVIRLAFIGAVGLTAAGCLSTKLKPGFCERDADCQSGYRCEAQMCACDSAGCGGGGMSGTGGGGSGGGGTGGDGGGAGDGGRDVQPTCQPSCMAPRSICDSNLTCVECLTSADCTTVTKPICDATGTCVACTSDEQCATKQGANPGVCMAHQDGRCATDAETIYVQNKTGCDDTVVANEPAGTLDKPFCSMEPVPVRLTPSRTVVVVRGTVLGDRWSYASEGGGTITVVGQQSPVVGSVTTPAFSLIGGTAQIRGVKFSSSASIGIRATGGTLVLERVAVDRFLGGGILLDGAAFDIRNTTVTNNGPGMDGAVNWGGVYVKSLPATGPRRIALSTVRMNDGGGISCSTAVDDGGDVLVIDNVNTAVQVSLACNLTPCTTASSTCGAQ